MFNVSKAQGPMGPPRYNGTQGPPGVAGPPGPRGYNGSQGPPSGSGSGGLSLCPYIKRGNYATTDVTVTETNVSTPNLKPCERRGAEKKNMKGPYQRNICLLLYFVFSCFWLFTWQLQRVGLQVR